MGKEREEEEEHFAIMMRNGGASLCDAAHLSTSREQRNAGID